MAKKQKNLPEVVPELFEHEQFGNFRFIKQGDELWFAVVDLCRALDIQNPRDAVSNFDDDEKMTVAITDGHSGKRGGAQFMNFVSEPGMYRLIFMSRKPEAKKFQRWVYHEVLPSIRKYGFYRLQQPTEKIYVEIIGEENFNLLKAKFPDVEFEIHHVRLGAERIVDCVEDTVYYYHVRLKPDDYEKISRDPLSLRCVDRFIPGKEHKSIGIHPTNRAMASES